MLKIMGKLKFMGNVKIFDDQVKDHIKEHQVDKPSYDKLSSGWKRSGQIGRKYCIGWKFELVSSYTPPFWIQWKNDP